eukprot:6206549-Prymnesium_polylepis.1
MVRAMRSTEVVSTSLLKCLHPHPYLHSRPTVCYGGTTAGATAARAPSWRAHRRARPTPPPLLPPA